MPAPPAERAAELASRVNFVVVTTLPVEHAAMLAMLDGPMPYVAAGRGADLIYVLGEIPARGGGTHMVALTQPAGMGTAVAGPRLALLLKHFENVEAVVVVGIASGVPWPENPDADVRLGDVVVSDKRGLVRVDFVKGTMKNVERRLPARPPPPRLLDTSLYLENMEMFGERPWEAHLRRGAHIEGTARPPPSTDVLVSTERPDEVVGRPADPQRREGMPRIFRGAIASSNTLLKDPEIRDRLRDELGVLAAEFEGLGITDTAWSLGVGLMVIRGICDYGDRSRDDRWQGYAAVAAAAYMRALLESTRTASEPKQRTQAKPKADPKVPNNLPPRRTFVGREEELEMLDDVLPTAPHVSLYGPAGVGKTALALEYAWRNQSLYPGGVYWVQAGGRPIEAMVTLGVELRNFGPRGMMEAMPHTATAEELATWARVALQSAAEAALVVLDGLSDEGFGVLLPASPVRVLVTTRSERLTLGLPVLVEGLSEEDAVRLAGVLAGPVEGEEDREARTRVVVEELEGLPVAVALAAQQVRRRATTWQRYEEELRSAAEPELPQESVDAKSPKPEPPGSVNAVASPPEPRSQAPARVAERRAALRDIVASLRSALRRLDAAPRALLVAVALPAGAAAGFFLLANPLTLRLAGFALLLLAASLLALTAKPVTMPAGKPSPDTKPRTTA